MYIFCSFVINPALCCHFLLQTFVFAVLPCENNDLNKVQNKIDFIREDKR